MIALPALGVFVGVAVLIALSYAYRNSLGALLQALAKVFIAATWKGPFGLKIGFAFLGDLILKLDNEIREAMAAGIQGGEWAWHQMIRHTAWIFQHMAATIENLATGTERALDRMARETIPAVVAALLLGPKLAISLLQAQVKMLSHVAANVARVPVKAVEHAATTYPKLSLHVAETIYRTVPAAAAKAVTVPWGQIRGLERDVTGLQKWVRAHRKAVTEGALAGGVIAVLSRVGLGWVRCSNVSRLGKNVCGMNGGLLESLLADTLLIFGTVSLVEFAAAMVSIQEGMAATVLAGFRETSGLDLSKTFTGYTGTLG